MQLLVLGGGFGTRLRSTVSDVPKALAPVNGEPFLKFQMDCWTSQGIKECIFLLYFEAQLIIDFLESWKQLNLNLGIDIQYLIEDKPLGTGGSVANAVKHFNLTSSFLVANADTWLDSGVKSLAKSPAPAIAITKVPDASRYGSVFFDKSFLVTAFAEKETDSKICWINAGLCHLKPDLFSSWAGEEASLENLYFLELTDNKTLLAVQVDDNFVDIGVPEDYHRFCQWVVGGQSGSL